MLQDYQIAFIELALKYGVLQFGDFTLKSGRQSPYFFNAGLFNDGYALNRVGDCFAQAIISGNFEYTNLFGPAYKGIPLATATASALINYDCNKPVTFNRKEAKEHGEKGLLIGAPLAGQVLIIDDVITAGTAFNAAKKQIETHGAQVSGVMVALDRCEKGKNEISTLHEIKQQGIQVGAIITLNDLCHFLEKTAQSDQLKSIQAYRRQYGYDPV